MSTLNAQIRLREVIARLPAVGAAAALTLSDSILVLKFLAAWERLRKLLARDEYGGWIDNLKAQADCQLLHDSEGWIFETGTHVSAGALDVSS
jgi:mannose/cellobiose epimerase-like protein (N-acyl-D-glucosamine 2-epimerase family)